MVGRTKPATKSEKDRMQLIKEQAWCIPCILNRTANRSATTVQHVVDGYRKGHRHTYGCCHYHHLGQLPGGLDKFDAYRIFGPSLAHGSKEYHRVWAPEDVLVRLQDELIELFEKNNWQQYNMPQHVVYEIRKRWQEMRY